MHLWCVGYARGALQVGRWYSSEGRGQASQQSVGTSVPRAVLIRSTVVWTASPIDSAASWRASSHLFAILFALLPRQPHFANTQVVRVTTPTAARTQPTVFITIGITGGFFLQNIFFLLFFVVLLVCANGAKLHKGNPMVFLTISIKKSKI